MREKLTRRQMLSITGSLGFVGLAGCSGPSKLFGNKTPEKPQPSDVINELTIKVSPIERSNQYFVAVSDDIMASENIDLFSGQQVRLTRKGENMRDFLFTISNDFGYTSNKEKTVWVSKNALERMDSPAGAEVSLKAFGASPLYNTRQEAKENNELIEQIIDSGPDVLFTALRGGQLQNNTELQAFRGSSENGYSSWSLIGYGSNQKWAYRKWYNPPEFYSPESFYGLKTLEPPFNRVISFTGFSEEPKGKEKHIIIGGLASDNTKKTIKKELENTFLKSNKGKKSAVDPEVIITIDYSGAYSGSDPNHLTNKLSEESTGGVLLTQGSVIKEKYWKEVADSVITAIDDL